MIILTKHFKERVSTRWSSNIISKEEYLIKRFKYWYKKKDKIIKKWKNNSEILYDRDFKFYFSKQNWDFFLVTFWIRTEENKRSKALELFQKQSNK